MIAMLNSFLPACAMLLLLAAGFLPPVNPWLSPLATAGLVEAGAFLVPMLIFIIINKNKGSGLNMRLKLAKLRYLPLILSTALAVSLLSFFINYIGAMVGGGALLQDTAFAATTRYGGQPAWALVLVLALVPALVEEWFFRGALLSGLEGWGQSAAILISALCFALIHGTPANFFGPLVAGVVYGYLTLVLGSVWPAVACHCINNLLYLLMGYFLNRYVAFGVWPYFLIVTICLLFVSIYLAASSMERHIEKGRIPRLKGSGGLRPLVRLLFCPGVLVVAALFLAKALLI